MRKNSQRPAVNSLPRRITFAHQDRKPARLSASLRDRLRWLRADDVKDVVLTSLYCGRRAWNWTVSISTPRTVTVVPLASLESWRGIPRMSVIEA